MKKYRVLIVHNEYQNRGGEFTVVESEKRLLQNNGHEVENYIRNNNEIDGYSLLDKICLLFSINFNKQSYFELKKILEDVKPDICHVHNIVPLISPAIYYACNEKNIPVIQTIHNYRYGCVNGNFYRNNNICEKCLNSRIPFSIIHKCYRNSFIQSFLIYRVFNHQFRGGKWGGLINKYIALSNFAKNKLIEIGLPEEKISVKPNFIFTNKSINTSREDFFLFVGRLEEKKGILELVRVFQTMKEATLHIVGDGPLMEEINTKASKNVLIFGQLSKEKVHEQLATCQALIFPSKWFEGMPMTILEAFANATPVIASKIGTMTEMIIDGVNGTLFEINDEDDLKRKIEWHQTHKTEAKIMGLKANEMLKTKYSPSQNYQLLMNIYMTTLKDYQSNGVIEEV